MESPLIVAEPLNDVRTCPAPSTAATLTAKPVPARKPAAGIVQSLRSGLTNRNEHPPLVATASEYSAVELSNVPTVERKSFPGGPLNEFDCLASVFHVVSAGSAHGTVTETPTDTLVPGSIASPFVLARNWITAWLPSPSARDPIATGFQVLPVGAEGVAPPAAV